VLSTFLAAYATSYNAYAITLNQITTAGVHYTIFGAFLLFGITLTAFLFVVFHFESSDAASYTRRWSRSFVYALPMFLLFFGICIFLEPRFEDGLEPIWAAKTHQRQ
jgi:hypothetical protein